MEYVVAQNQTHAVVADKLLADDERLRQTVGTRLLGILEPHAVIGSVAQQTAETAQILRSGYYEYVADARQHKHRYRIINHRLS